MVDLTNEAQAELRGRIQALNPKNSTGWVFRWGEGRWCMPRTDFTGTRVCVTLDGGAAERVKQSLLKPAKPLAHLRFNDRVRDIAGADSELIPQDSPVNEGTLVGDGKIRKAGETRFRVKTPSLNYRTFTVAVRFRLKEAGIGEQPIVTCGPQTGWFRARVRNGHLLVNLSGGDRRYGSVEIDAGPVRASQWYDLVCFARRAELETRLFLNGKEVKRKWIPEVGTFASESLDVGDRNFRIVPSSIATESLNKPLPNASDSEKE